MKTVLILFGGQSSEHEVSRVSARNVLANIDMDKYHVVTVGITRDGRWLLFDGPIELMDDGGWQAYAEAKQHSQTPVLLSPFSLREFVLSFSKGSKIDAVFTVMHGINAEDGTLQGLLELCGLPYVGSGVLGSSMSMDKEISKLIFEKAGIPQGKYFCVDRNEVSTQIDDISRKVEAYLGFPCFVKPANAGSSVGVSKAKDAEELRKALEEAGRFDKKILIEQYINGREIECAVLGNDSPKASPVGEITPSNDFYDYSAKYLDNSSVCEIPAKLSPETAGKIQEYAVTAFKALQCSGLSRVDFFLERTTGEIFINEINTIPGFTSISMYPMLWQEAGLSYQNLISTLIELAIERFESTIRAID